MRGARLLLLLCACAAPATARAAAGVQAAVLLSGGWDDNPPALGAVASKPDFFADLRPRLALALLEPRAALRLEYTFLGLIYARQSGENSYGNRLELSALITPTGTLTVGLTAGATEGSITAFTTSQPSDTTILQAVPVGTSYYLNTRAQEQLFGDLSPRWRITQSALF